MLANLSLPTVLLLVACVLACGDDPAPPTAVGTNVIEWTRPARGTGSIEIGEPAGEALTYRDEVRFTAGEGRAGDPEAGVAVLELVVERRPFHVEGHEADPVWVPNRVVLTVRDPGRWTISERSPAEFSSNAVHSGTEAFPYHIPASFSVALSCGSRQGSIVLGVSGHPRVQAIPAFGTANVVSLEAPRPRPPADPPPASADANAELLEAARVYVRENAAAGFEFELELQAVEGDFARLGVDPVEPDDGALLFMKRGEDGWTGVSLGTAISCADLTAGGMPQSLGVGTDP